MIFDMIKKGWAKYMDWIMELPVVIGAALCYVTVVTPILILIFGMVGIINSHFKTKCLDSQLARRWSPTSRICEEYHDGEWIKADLSGDNIYYYNNAASR